MKKRRRGSRFSVAFLLGLSIVILEFDYLVPMPETMHHVCLVTGIVLLLFTGISYFYEQVKLNNPDDWWKDDDWTHPEGV